MPIEILDMPDLAELPQLPEDVAIQRRPPVALEIERGTSRRLRMRLTVVASADDAPGSPRFCIDWTGGPD